MPELAEPPYRLQPKDVARAAAVAADAFREDPLWSAIFAGEATQEQRLATFEAPLIYCLKYGQVWATGPDLVGIAAWLPGRYARMTLWRTLRSGAIRPGLRIGARLSAKMEPMFRPVDADREAHMGARPFIYLQILAVAPAQQGQGLGGRLLRTLIAKCDREQLPLYLETETERNVRLYEHFGFRVLSQITLPVVSLPLWEMVKEPQATAEP